MELTTNLASLAAITAAISSSLCNVVFFSRATHTLAMISVDCSRQERKTTAPQSLVLASANTCNCVPVSLRLVLKSH